MRSEEGVLGTELQRILDWREGERERERESVLNYSVLRG